MHKILSALALLPILAACSSEPAEFKNTSISNNLFYLKKTGKPFSGQIKNVPYENIRNPQLNLAINSYFSFISDPTLVEHRDTYPSVQIRLTCDIETKDGQLDGKIKCLYRNQYRDIPENTMTFEAKYKKGQLNSEIIGYRPSAGKNVQVETVNFLDDTYQNVNFTVYALNKPDQKIFIVEKKGIDVIQKLYANNGKLIMETTRINNERKEVNSYDPNTGESIGKLTFNPQNSYVPYNGYWVTYAMNIDQDPNASNPDAKITEVKYLKDGTQPLSRSYLDSTFNLKMFNDELAKEIQAQEKRNNEWAETMDGYMNEPNPALHIPPSLDAAIATDEPTTKAQTEDQATKNKAKGSYIVKLTGKTDVPSEDTLRFETSKGWKNVYFFGLDKQSESALDAAISKKSCISITENANESELHMGAVIKSAKCPEK